KFYSILADILSKTRVVVHGAALTKTPNALTFYTHNSSLSASHDLQPPSILTQSEYSLISPLILSTLLATQNILAHLLLSVDSGEHAILVLPVTLCVCVCVCVYYAILVLPVTLCVCVCVCVWGGITVSQWSFRMCVELCAGVSAF